MVSIEKLNEFTGHKGPLYALIDYGNGMITAGSDRMIVSWPDLQRNEGSLLAMSTGTVYSLLYLNQKNRLLASNDSGGIHVIDLSTQKETRLLQFHKAPVFDMQAAAGEKLMMTASGDGTLALTETDEFSLLKQIKISEQKVRCMQWMLEEQLLAVGTGEGRVYIFEFPELKLIEKVQAHQEHFSVNTLAYWPEKKLLITGGRDAYVNLFSMEGNFQKEESIPAHNYSVYSIVFSPDKKRMATASRDKTIKIWEPEHFKVLKRISLPEFLSHTHSVNKLLWKERGLISIGDDRKIILWSVT
jgi:WD40 repeat protein